MFWKLYLFPPSGIHVILFPDAEEIEKLPATAVHFCFELMWLVIEVFVTCVIDVLQTGIHCLLRFHTLRAVLLRFISSGM